MIVALINGSLNVSKWSSHDMRRSFFSDMLDNAVDISTVAALAGHSSISTTRRYDRRTDEAKKRAAKVYVRMDRQ
jgi:integrase